MSYAELEAKIAKIPPEYHQELIDFIDFLIERPRASQNGLDMAIAELENGEYETYADFDEFLKEVEHDS